MRYLTALLIPGLLAVGYQCSRVSGTWENDAGNWARAFGVPPPAEIEIVHSFYSRTPHFMREEHWAFHIKSPASFHQDWTAADKLEIPGPEDAEKIQALRTGQPGWFAPGSLSEYEIRIPAADSALIFAVFINRTTGEWFVTACG